jgi:hypothetical protein
MGMAGAKEKDALISACCLSHLICSFAQNGLLALHAARLQSPYSLQVLIKSGNGEGHMFSGGANRS